MNTTQQAEALPALIERFRGLHFDHAPDGWPAVRTREITALLARITELESQLAQRFDAADMATAASQGFRDGVASVSAGWISVDERLPEKNTEVLICFAELAIPSTGRYTASALDHEGWCYPQENNLWPGEHPDFEDGGPPTVTHWMPLPAAPQPSPTAQAAESVPAIQGETNAQLDTDSNPTAPGQQRDMACSLALGQPVGNGSDQVAGHPSAQGNKLLTVAERNIRSFLRSATFKSESDREAALKCVDVLWEAARASADSVLEDAACWHWLAEYLVGTRTDLDDEIVASETVNDLRKLVEAAMNKGATQ